ncbi:hypothetical protein E2C01_047323 [Portunus trituberculatus]|uniref:HTH psq-type domain-containing protein n=1 Tax=Portunus trituberculatus TaxID=210409 RepID=A0A5B7G885_PORTR|nr:hypothetical protein [Portunus trituberculatus]
MMIMRRRMSQQPLTTRAGELSDSDIQQIHQWARELRTTVNEEVFPERVSALGENTEISRFDRLTRQFDIHISRATHPVKSAATPPNGSVYRCYPVPSFRQAMLHCSTSCLHTASTMPCKATSSPSPKKHNFLPFKDKLELIRKCKAGIAHSVVAAEMGVPRSTVSTIWKNRDKCCETAAKLGTRSESLSGLAWDILRWCEDNLVSLRPRFMLGWYNAVADILSRECVGSEWTLHPLVCRQIFQVWDALLVDLFATALNYLLPLYGSPLLDLGTWKENVFAFPLDSLYLYAFPPFSLIHWVLLRIRGSACVRMTMIALWWHQAD